MKRLFDIFFAVVGLVVLAPLGLLLALAVKLADGGAMFYGQVRVGQFGKRFWIWKFRSMVVNADKLGPPLTQEEDRRITAIGRFLRRTKLDELPQLWNVLVGEISFVGPRPEAPRYVDQYTPEQREVLRLKPGITDMASMLFRNEQELLKGASDLEGFYLRHCLPKKIELNRQYAERASLRQDVWIILQTLCPYWVAVLCVYSLCLAVSFWATYQLRFDFRVTSQAYEEFWRGLPWVVGLQLAALVWLGQLRGLMSYFRLPELKRTLRALGWAALAEAGLLRLVQGQSAPVLGIILLDAILSAAVLAGVRLGLRSLREHFASPPRTNARNRQPQRVAVVGTGELATKFALDFAADGKAGQVIAFFGDDPRTWNKRPHDIPVVGMPECLLSPEWRSKIDEVIVALPDEESVRAREIGNMLLNASVKVSCISTWPELKPLEV